ncbi:MAG: TetR/AcrR family transcriptional regulator [Solirubrobacterales bacterium]
MKPTRPVLPKEFVAARKRRRIMDAIAELSAEQGYEATKIGDLVRRAGVARKTLYDNFEGKEEVFLAAIDSALQEALGRVEEACTAAGEDWSERFEAGLGALLDHLAEHPAEAHMCMIDALSATPASGARYDDALHRFVELMRRNAPANTGLPETIEDTLVGGIAWILSQQVRRGKVEQAPELLPELFEFAISPYRGVEKSVK